MEISKCGTAKSQLVDSGGFSWPTDQQPNCLPYSNVFMSNDPFNGETMRCPGGNKTMMETVCNKGEENDYECQPESYTETDCCISSSNCSSTVLGCDALRDTGAKICGDLGTESMTKCDNPCASVINIPSLEDGTKDEMWQAEVCEFFCPSIDIQNFWFGDPDDSDNYEDTEITGDPKDRYKSRICSEEYFNLCRLAGCNISETCKTIWGEQQGEIFRNYPTQYPIVYTNEPKI